MNMELKKQFIHHHFTFRNLVFLQVVQLHNEDEVLLHLNGLQNEVFDFFYNPNHHKQIPYKYLPNQ